MPLTSGETPRLVPSPGLTTAGSIGVVGETV